MYAQGASEEDIEYYIKKQSGTKPKDFEPPEITINNVTQTEG